MFALVEERLGAAGDEIVFVDDTAEHVQAAARRGWRSVLHVDTERTIREVQQHLAG